MITKQEDIKNIFNIFHDGDIVKYTLSDQTLRLDVEIPYLAERINKRHKSFRVTLYGCQNIHFQTWPNQEGVKGDIISDLKTIFKPKLWILSASAKHQEIEVNCSQTNPNFNYCGGNLSFKVNSVLIEDENGQQYTVKELYRISEEYWEDWEKKKKNSITIV